MIWFQDALLYFFPSSLVTDNFLILLEIITLTFFQIFMVVLEILSGHSLQYQIPETSDLFIFVNSLTSIFKYLSSLSDDAKIEAM